MNPYTTILNRAKFVGTAFGLISSKFASNYLLSKDLSGAMNIIVFVLIFWATSALLFEAFQFFILSIILVKIISYWRGVC